MRDRTVSRRWIRLITMTAGLALIVAACGGAAATPTAAPATPAPTGAATVAPPVDALAEVCAAGATEGKLVNWNNHSDEYVKVIEAFSAAYPDIEVENLVLEPDEAAQRILTEAAANRQITPDVAAGGLDVFKPLFDRDLIALDVDWEALGAPADVIHDLNIIRIHRVALGIVYNTDKHTAADLPNTWEELVDAKWSGRVIVDPRGRPFDSFALSWGKDKALDYVQRLKEIAKPLVIQGGTAGMVAVAGGEADITTGGRSAETLEQQAEGAPLEIKYLDVVSTIDNYEVVFKDALHPNAARCFTGWFAKEGQAIYDEVEFKTNDAIPPQAPANATIVVIESPEDANLVKDVGREMGRIWTGG